MKFGIERIKEKIFGLKGLAWIGFGDIAGSGITAIFWFYIASILETDSYGEIHYLLGIAGIAFTFSKFGSPHVITVFSAKKTEINSTLYLISLIIAGISASIIFILILSPEPSFIVLGYIIGALVLAEMLGRNLYKLYAKYVLSQKILTVIFGLVFFHLMGIEGILFGIALSHLPFIARFVNEFRHDKIDFNKIKQNFDFISNNYILVLADGFRNNVDKLIIVPLLGFSILGNYALGMQIFAILMLGSNIVFKYVLSHDAQGIPKTKIKNLTIISSVVFAALGFFISPILIPLTFPNFIPAIDVIQIVSIAVIPATIGQMQISKFLGNENSRPVLISRILGMVSMLSGVLLLGPLYGLQGLAFSYLLSSTIQTGFLFFSSKKLSTEVLKVAKKIASKSNLTIKIGKQAFYKQLEMPLRKAYAYTSKMMTINMMAMDAGEGISAFLEKRKPNWK